MTQEELLKIKREIEAAEQDTKPVIAVVNDEIHVQGDPSNTEVLPQNYTANFIFPKTMKINMDGMEDLGHGYVGCNIEYKDVFPSAKNNMKYTSAIAQLLPFFRKMEETGDITELSEEEAVKLFAALEDEIVDALYRLVQVVLEVDEAIMDYMAPSSVFEIASAIIHDFPSVVNQADLFFGLSTEKA